MHTERFSSATRCSQVAPLRAGEQSLRSFVMRLTIRADLPEVVERIAHSFRVRW